MRKTKSGRVTRKRVDRAINYISEELSSCKDDYALIADIIVLLASKKCMSAQRAQDALNDAEKIIPYISELKLL